MHGSFRVLCCSLLLCFVATLTSSAQTSDFSIVVLPDTQNEAEFFPQILALQTGWIVDQRAALNIQVVLGEGDIVNNGSSDAQQQNADAAFRLLDTAGIPYFLAIGNHDYDTPLVTGLPRSTVGFNRYFGPTRYAGKPWYLGNFPAGSNENFYGVLNIAGQPFLFLALEYVPRTIALDWAESVMTANPDKKVIVVTHSFLYPDGTRVDRCDTKDMVGDNDGDKVWARLRKHANLVMVLNGHLTNGVAARRADIGTGGNLVNQMFANYQEETNGGNGWLRILTFHPLSNTITVQTFSPFLGTFRTDAANQFTIPYRRPAIGGTTGTMSGRVRDNSTCLPIAGATVRTGNISTTTGADGRYSILISAGTQQTSVSAPGWGTQSATDTVYTNFSTDLNFYLTPPTGSTAPCKPGLASPSVTVCTPANLASVTSPVHVVAATTDSVAVSFLQIYVDGSPVFTKTGGTLDATVPIAVGTHRLTVQAKDVAGVIFKQSISVTVH